MKTQLDNWIHAGTWKFWWLTLWSWQKTNRNGGMLTSLVRNETQ